MIAGVRFSGMFSVFPYTQVTQSVWQEIAMMVFVCMLSE